MVIHLAKMVREVRCEVLQEKSRLEPVAADLDGKRLVELRGVERRERARDLVRSSLDPLHELGARHTLLRELGVTVANESRRTKLRADVEAEVADEVQREIARGIGTALRHLPEGPLVGVGEQFVAKRCQLAIDEAGKIGGGHETGPRQV